MTIELARLANKLGSPTVQNVLTGVVLGLNPGL